MLIKNIGILCGIQPQGVSRLAGLEMKQLNTINNAYLLIENGLIASYGSMADLPQGNDDEVIDASGKIVLPGWVDSHTHIVFAKSREGEFEDRINGLSYEEIAEKGGGILQSAARLAEATEDELFESAYKRLQKVITYGTTAIEIKSGYGLSTDTELKMLRVIKRLKAVSPISIKANFLGAHALPVQYKANRQAYIDLIVNDMLPKIASEGLADYIDVFCDRGFFTPKETDEILKAGAKHGLKPKIHANELDFSGGVQVGAANGAISMDHLECVAEAEIEAMLASKTVATLLPSTAFFLKLPHYPPARMMLNANLPVALATDFNPGSSPSGRMGLTLSIACTQMRMTPAEAINAATINGAAALELGEVCGSITVGKWGNVIITEPLPSYQALPYYFGDNWVETVIVNGKKVYSQIN